MGFHFPAGGPRSFLMRDKSSINWRLFGVLYFGYLVVGLPLAILSRLLAGISLAEQMMPIVTSAVATGLVFILAIRVLGSVYVTTQNLSGYFGIKRLAVLYGTVLVLTGLSFYAFRWEGRMSDNLLLQLLLLTTVRCLGLTIFTAVYFFIVGKDLKAKQAKRVAELELLAQEAEMERLRAQINPHFLFNALAAIAGKTTQPEVDQMAQGLADLLRYNLSHAGAEAPFEVEAQAIRSYLKVEQLRFGAQLRVEFTVTPEAGAAYVPQPLLLPLVENAIKYGHRTTVGPLWVRIGVEREGATLIARVENTGRWVEPAALAPAGTQIGLANLKRRLELLSQGQARVEQEVRSDTVCMTVTWPLALGA